MAGKTEPEIGKIPEIAKFLKITQEELLESLIDNNDNNDKNEEPNKISNAIQENASHSITIAESLQERSEFK